MSFCSYTNNRQQRIWPLLSSLTLIPGLPFGAVLRKALGKDLRKKVLTEYRFPIASAKGKTSTQSGSDPWRTDNQEGSLPFGERISKGSRNSKAPPRNPEEIPSGRSSGRTDGTWDPPIHGNVLGCFITWNGFLRAIYLPSFPFFGRDSNRYFILIQGPFHRETTSPEVRTLWKDPLTGKPKCPP